MAQSLYSGIQGSGKSYEVVQGVILPNIAKGRRVVTNVAGLNYELICDYCVNNLGADRSKLGEIVQIDNEEVSEPGFFPLEEKESPFLQAIKRATDPGLIADLEQKHKDWKTSFKVKGGDIVILDECWRWYTSDTQLPDNHLKFFRMHRHFLHPETGQCCDIVLIAQDIADLRRNIRATVEKSFLMQKHTDLGMPDRYVVSVYSGNKQTSRAFIEDFQKKYNPDIFPLYQSHSQKDKGGADAKEERVDKRGSIFNRKIIKYGIPAAVLWIGFAGWWMWGFFHPEGKKPALADTKAVAGVSPAPLPPVVPLADSKPKRDVGISDLWRLVGSYRRGASEVWILADGAGRLRHISDPKAIKFTPGEVELMLPDGDFVTFWSGAVKGQK